MRMWRSFSADYDDGDDDASSVLPVVVDQLRKKWLVFFRLSDEHTERRGGSEAKAVVAM